METLELKQHGEALFIELGKRLHTIRERELFKPSWETFEDYCEEFKWKPSTASRLINIYSRFVLEYQIPPKRLAEAGGWTVLAEILPIVKNKADAETWIDKTTTHSRADIRKDIQEARGTLPEDQNCKRHEWYMIRICRKCGTKEQVYDAATITKHHHPNGQ